jgi:hypothetical protein
MQIDADRALPRDTTQAASASASFDIGELSLHISAALDGLDLPLDDATLPIAVRRLVQRCPTLPSPGSGCTLTRWRFLASLAARDLPLVKLYEAHADARAILSELGTPSPFAGRDEFEIWGVWAARTAQGDLRIVRREGQDVYLCGTKPWCSGAQWVSHALVTCVDQAGAMWLAAVPMKQSGVRVSERGWESLGMQVTRSVEIDLMDAKAVLIGSSNAYLDRPGFWQGGAGIAACWYGAAAALGVRIREAAGRRSDPHLHAHLGSVDIALSAARAQLRAAAASIDSLPDADARTLALRTRGVVESAVENVLRAAGRGLGAGPLCKDRWFAHMCTDLAVFVRQSHAEHDLESLGCALASSDEAWQL